MIRRSILSVNSANEGKLRALELMTLEMTGVVNLFIDELWKRKDFKSKFVNFKVDTRLTARLQQCLGKQALEIVKSQRKRKKKSKPVFTGKAFNLDSRFVDFQDGNSFDIWLRLSSMVRKIQLKLPTNAHKHYNKFTDWNRSKSIRLLKRPNGWFIEVFFETESPAQIANGKTIGVDIGYKKLLVTSELKKFDEGLERIYEKISRKKQGSKSFKKSLIERNNTVNKSLNKLELNGVSEVVCENLKNIKRNSKGRIFKKFNNKLQRWTYPGVLRKLQHMTEESGVLLTKVNPAHTSQKCCKCGVICKSNRKGETYKCACGNTMDADFNAAVNLSHMGVYSPHISYCNVC